MSDINPRDRVELPRPYLGPHNGAVDPNRWSPTRDNLIDPYGRSHAQVGQLVAWRYAAWRVVEANLIRDVDLHTDDREDLSRYNGDGKFDRQMRQRLWPQRIVLEHVNGPFLIKNGEPSQRLHDGRRTIHITFRAARTTLLILKEPYQTCSCHGHPWPCQDIDQIEYSTYQAARLALTEASHADGMCFHCREPISTRQKVLTFPEPSFLLPGAPGPLFHAGRGACWAAAEEYERVHRITFNPDVIRLASCPGIRFIHEARDLPTDRRLDCTAGPACTGHHGPPGHRHDVPCWEHVDIAANDGAYARPTFDCGYRMGAGRECIGGDLSGGGSSLSPTAADILWEQRQRDRRHWR